MEDHGRNPDHATQVGERETMGLLTDIETAATTSSEPLPDLLRRCKVLAARLKNKEFATWVEKELNGYQEEDELPSYRVVETPHSKGDFSGPWGSGLKNAPLPLHNLDPEIRRRLMQHEFRQGVGEIQKIAATKNITMQWPSELIALTQRDFISNMALMSARIYIPVGAMDGILDTIRTRVLDFVLAIQAADPTAGDSPPSAAPPIPHQTVSNVFHNTIIGGHANIGVTGDATIDNSDTANTFALPAQKVAELASLISAARSEAVNFPAEQKSTALTTIEQVAGAANAKRMTPEGVKQWAAALTAVASATTAMAPNVSALAHWLNAIF